MLPPLLTCFLDWVLEGLLEGLLDWLLFSYDNLYYLILTCVFYLLSLTVAEFFRDGEGQDGMSESGSSSCENDANRLLVLLFIDNIFRFTQAGSEVSALLGRIPSAVGYQPTLAVDMGVMQERITTLRKDPSHPCRPSTSPLTI